MQKKLHSLIDIAECFIETNQLAWAQWSSGCSVFQRRERQAIFCHTTKQWTSQSAHLHELGDWDQGAVQSWTPASVCWLVSDGGSTGILKSLHQVCLTVLTQEQKECCMQVFQVLLNQYKAESEVPLITSLLVMTCGVSAMSQSQNSNPWRGDMSIPHQRKSSRCSPQQLKWCMYIVFGTRKGWSFWNSCNLDKILTLINVSHDVD